MKKQVLVALAIAAMSAVAAYAAPGDPGTGITDSVHDMNTLGAYNVQPDGQGRVCAFCHTPHHAMTGDSGSNYLPLWSHQLTDYTVFTPYQSGTLDSYKNGTPDLLVGPTRLCMSCHDGAIAVDQHYGSDATTTNRKFSGNDFTGSEPQIAVGKDGSLAGTHPIGFILADAVAADAAATGSNATGAAGFNDGVADGSKVYLGNPKGKTIGSQLFNGYMTCATCHDVHNKDNATNGITVGVHVDTANRNYFVFSPQAGSQLCLTCHNK